MLIARNIVENNVSAHGAGIFILHQSPLIEDNVIRYNRSTIMGWGTGLYLVHGCRSEVRRNLIYGNQPGGLYIGDGSQISVFENNVVFGNRGGPAFLIYQNSRVSIRNSIIWDHQTTVTFAGGGNAAEAEFSVIDRISNIDIGERVLRINPDFVDPDEDNLNLLPISYCIDAGDPESPNDPDGSRAESGALPYDHDGQYPSITLDIHEIEVDVGQESTMNIENDGEFPLWVVLNADAEWIDIDPDALRRAPDEDDDVFVMIRC